MTGFYTGNEQSYDEVFSMTSVGNATVYIGGINPNTSGLFSTIINHFVFVILQKKICEKHFRNMAQFSKYEYSNNKAIHLFVSIAKNRRPMPFVI